MNELILQNLPDLPFDIEESINQLRVNLSFCGDQIRTVMITSSVPNEGKSFITLNLWRLLASLGNRVLLIDCDLRGSVIRTKYEIKSKEKLTGIAHYLSGQIELKEAIYKTNINNGYFMPVEATVANPAILLENQRFSTMIQQCSDLFDFILIDTPPLGSVADALRIAVHTDGTVLVIQGGKTSRKLVENTVYQLRRTGTKLLGIVLNRVYTDRRGSYYYKKYYHQGYYNKNYQNMKSGKPGKT